MRHLTFIRGGCYATIQDEGKTLKILPLGPHGRDEEAEKSGDVINPDYYKRGGLEAIDVIEAFFMHSPHLANAFKYLVRMGEKPGNSVRQDADKTKWYIDRWVSVQDK